MTWLSLQSHPPESANVTITGALDEIHNISLERLEWEIGMIFIHKSELRAQRQAGGSAAQWRQNSKTSWAVFEWERSQAAGTYNEADATHDVCSSQAVSRTTHPRIRGQLSEQFSVILPRSFKEG